MQVDWTSIFVPTTPLAEIFVRGSVVYLSLFFLLRALRREAGAIGLSDLLVVVLIADAAQNAMANEYKSLTEGAVLVGTIVFWDYFLDWLGYQFPIVRRLLRPKPLLLIKDGQMKRKNMRQELITREELLGQLREQGVENVEEVKTCYLEAEGHISVIKTDNATQPNSKSKRLAS